MEKRKFWWAILIMMALCTITYSNHFQNDFHFDDSHTIQNNVYIRNIHNIPLFFTDGSTSSTLPQNQSYRPVVTTSLAIDYWLGGDYYLFFFHFDTFLLFLLQGLLMVWFFRKIFNLTAPDLKFNTYVALIGVTFYLLHPAIAETVNYVIARSDLQSTLAVVAAFVLYQHSKRWNRFYLYLTPIIIGTLAKPTAIMFAPLLFFYVMFFEEQLGLANIFNKRLFNVIKKTLPAFICCGFLYWLQGHLTPNTWQPGGTSPLQYLITQPFVIAHYFQMFFWPNGLSADSDWGLITGMADWRFITGSAFILVMLVIAFFTSRKKELRPISFGILWFFLALLPTSSIIPLAEVLNDHRMFFPFVGLLISISWTVALLIKSYLPKFKIALSIMLGVILTISAYATWQRNEVWYNEETLWHDVTIKSPNNGRGLMNYGLSKMAAGDYATADIYYTRALKLLPSYFSLYVNLGILKAATGQPALAESYFKMGQAYGSNYPDAYIYYARFLNQQHRYPEAITNLQRAIALSFGNIYARTLLMEAYQNTENWAELKALALATRQLAPDNTETQKYLQAAEVRKSKTDSEAAQIKASPTAEKYLALSLSYYSAERYQQCVDACMEAIKLKPNFPEAYNNICAAYNRLGRWAKAIEFGKMGLHLNPNNQLLKNNLAEAYKHR
ncbi:tetratricopeptide repeat protein [Mucilaginibacter sp. UYCu711]|uniref:tetratricopeptide repeat protein n=1 Tax=Mucilaginibacter sp. UYCu711 TaxID=3156339 RepID=UPI003D1B5941